MPAYLDSSALVKRYVHEPGTAEIDRLFAHEDVLLTASIAWSECLAAFARKRHEGSLGARRYDRVCEAFATEWRSLTEIALSREIRDRIRVLLDAAPLRGMDAIHLASALWAERRLGTRVAFVGSDRKLATAARELGLRVVSPDEP